MRRAWLGTVLALSLLGGCDAGAGLSTRKSAIGSADLKLGRLGQAEQVLRRAVELEPDFVPALNNLGVVLMERGKTGEAKRVFEQAFAFDSGASDAIRENLRLAIAATEQNVYSGESEANGFSLVRQGQGEYLLLTNL